MRVVSLLPAATEWVCAMGAEDALVGRSHECDWPAAVRELPAVTRASVEDAGDSAAIDAAVQERLQDGLSLYSVDLDRLRELDPDVILTQTQCDVCAVTPAQLDDALADWTGAEPTVVSLAPQTLKQVFDGALRIGRAIDRLDAAMQVLARGEARLKALRNQLGLDRSTNPASLPTIACIEWLEPLMTAGHWMPDVAEMAGAQAVAAEAGAPSRPVEWEALREADPDAIAVIPCGFSLEETERDLHYLTDRPGWQDLKAVREGRVVAFDGNAYFNRPGPRLYRAVELLATALHPDRVDLDPPPSEDERRRVARPRSSPA